MFAYYMYYSASDLRANLVPYPSTESRYVFPFLKKIKSSQNKKQKKKQKKNRTTYFYHNSRGQKMKNLSKNDCFITF
jgi:hypothetical protein